MKGTKGMKALKPSLTCSLLKAPISFSQSSHSHVEQQSNGCSSPTAADGAAVIPAGSSRAVDGTVIQNHAQERTRQPCYRSTSH